MYVHIHLPTLNINAQTSQSKYEGQYILVNAMIHYISLKIYILLILFPFVLSEISVRVNNNQSQYSVLRTCTGLKDFSALDSPQGAVAGL